MFCLKLIRSAVIVSMAALLAPLMPGLPVSAASAAAAAEPGPWASFVSAVQAVKGAADGLVAGYMPVTALETADTSMTASFGQVGASFEAAAASLTGQATALSRLSQTRTSLTASYSKLYSDAQAVVSDTSAGQPGSGAAAAVDSDVTALLARPSTATNADTGPDVRPASHEAIPVVQDPASFHPAFSNGPAPSIQNGTPATSVSQLATSLHDPRAIYEWVLTHVVFAPQWGVIQGADGCLQSLQCDIQDTADLLAALLQADGVPVRFVTGTVELSPAQFRAAMGGFTSLPAAEAAAADGGIPIAVQQDGQHIAGVLIEDVWVQADLGSENVWVGADLTGRDGFGPGPSDGGWVSMDAALKPMAFLQPVDLAKIAGVRPGTLAALGAGALTDPTVPTVTGLNAARIQQAVTTWQTRIAAYEQARADQGATFGQVFGGETLAVNPRSPILGPPGRIVSSNPPASAIPAGQSWSTAVSIVSADGTQSLSLAIPTSTFADQRLTLGYVPATAADNQLMASFGGLYNTPPYLLDVLPVLYLDGQPAASGTGVTMGSEQQVTVTFTEPSGVTDSSTHVITAGTFAVVGVGLSQSGSGVLAARSPYLAATIAQAKKGQPVELDDVIGETLEDQELEYYTILDAYERIEANQDNVLVSYRPREMLMAFAPAFTYVGGVPVSVNGVSMGMDLRDFIVTVQSRDGDAGAAASTLLNISTMSSAWESGIFQLTQDDPAISTEVLLAQASASDVPVAGITAGNASEALSHLNLPDAYVANIQAEANSGELVMVPESQLTVNGWSGAAWAAFNPDGGIGEFIGGGVAGGSTTTQTPSLTADKNLVDEAFGDTAGTIGEQTLKVVGQAGLAAVVNIAGEVGNVRAVSQTAFEVEQDTGSYLKGEQAGAVQLLGASALAGITDSIIATAAAGGAVTLGVIVTAAVPILASAIAIGLIVRGVVYLIKHSP